MKCPYCAEEIKDEATFCYHCRHDFGLVKPLLARLISLESQVNAFSAVVAPSTAQATSVSIFAAGIAVTLGVTLTSGFFLVAELAAELSAELAENIGIAPYIFAIALPPVLLGLLVGMASSRRNPRAAMAAGLALGVVNYLLIWLMLRSDPVETFQWKLAMTTVVGGQSLTFATFTLLGNSLRGGAPPSRRSREGELKGAGRRLSDNLSLIVEFIKSVTFLGATIGFAYQWLRG